MYPDPSTPVPPLAGMPGPERRIYLISPEGGTPEAVTPARYRPDTFDWSPDGDSVIFGQFPGEPGGDDCALYRLNLRTRQIAKLPGSDGLLPQSFSPDGKDVAAVTTDRARLILFNVQSRRRTELVGHGNSLYAAYWSRDGKYIYFQDLGGGVDQAICRVRVRDHRSEVVATLRQFARSDALAYSLAGLAPDGSPLGSLILARGDIYALDVDFR
jgi:Tol biopolymer transport system component